MNSDEFVQVIKEKNPKRHAANEDSVQSNLSIQSQSHSQATPAKKAKQPNMEFVAMREIHVPTHRYIPLKENWVKIFHSVFEHDIQIHFNPDSKNVELRLFKETENTENLNKAFDFIQAFMYGFEVNDALVLLRLDDQFVESFEIKDIVPLIEDPISCVIDRLVRKGGRTKFTIESVSKTKIILRDSKIHILGSFKNIQLARRAIRNLI